MNSSLFPRKRVVLKSFKGAHTSPPETRPEDRYWRLIGYAGTVLSEDDASEIGRHARGPRVLVQFDESVTALGLACHNPVPNSLWIFVSDLQEEKR